MDTVTGSLFVYRIFDAGPDFNLAHIEKNLRSNNNDPQRLDLNHVRASIYVSELPLEISMGQTQIELPTIGLITFNAKVKLWPFGAISVVLENQLSQTPWEKLNDIAYEIERSQKVTDLTWQIGVSSLSKIGEKRDIDKSLYEDYTIFLVKEYSNSTANALDILNLYNMTCLLMAENKASKLSQQVTKATTEQYIQYHQNDLVIINWNSALVVDPSGAADALDMIEFALCQVLEMQYFDHKLDLKLSYLYDRMSNDKLSLWRNDLERLSKEAAQYYIEISDTVESVENSIKAVGDFYLAQVLRMASLRFRFKDWQTSLDQKLSNLADISRLLNSNLNERRNQILELIIILLIAVELLPMLVKLI